MDDFDLLYDRYADMVYRICFVMLHGSTQDAEDATQTVFLKYFETTEKPEGDHIKPWLIVVARNVCKTKLRSFGRMVSTESLPETGTDFPYNDVIRAVTELPEKERMAVMLCLYEGYTAAQTAEIMGCRENTVYSYLHRARKKLRKALGE